MRFRVADEHLGGLVRVRPAVAVEGAFFERLGRVLVRFGHHGYPEVGDGEVAPRRDEDVSWLQVTMDDAPIVEVVHAQGLREGVG